jgi:hypothetical protein
METQNVDQLALGIKNLNPPSKHELPHEPDSGYIKII